MSSIYRNRLTESVVAVIEPNVQRAEIERLKQKPASSLGAYDLLLRALKLQYEFTEQRLTEALRYLEQALTLDPNYAAAMALAANCYGERVHNGRTRDIAAETAKGLPLAERALDLGHDDGNVVWMVAHAILRLGRDRERANELAYASLGQNPNSAIAMTIAGLTEVMSGNSDKALELLHRAQRLSPRDPRGWLTTSVLSLAYFVDGQFEEAASTAKKSLMQNPHLGAARRVLAASLAKLGDRDRAADAIQ